MSRKMSEEARVIAYFENASPEMANIMLGIVRARVKARTPAQPKPAKRSHKAKTNTVPSQVETVTTGQMGVAQ